MAECVPIKEMKDTAGFARRVEQSRGPITVTRNGYDAFVVMRSDEYEAMQEELSKARLLAKAAQAEHEYATGQYSEGKEFTAGVKAKYGL
ncbi:MAG: type II toxin-antitoxin system Phd/YefM family antitoxin [Raoultibacter sp.]|jgi:prevent-host-death family protein